jgi:hypothetical protein
MLFTEIVVYNENHTKPTLQNTELLTIKAGGTYIVTTVL